MNITQDYKTIQWEREDKNSEFTLVSQQIVIKQHLLMLTLSPAFSKQVPWSISSNPYNSTFREDAIITPILQKEKLKPRCGELKLQGHTADQRQSWDLNGGGQMPGLHSYPLGLTTSFPPMSPNPRPLPLHGLKGSHRFISSLSTQHGV